MPISVTGDRGTVGFADKGGNASPTYSVRYTPVELAGCVSRQIPSGKADLWVVCGVAGARCPYDRHCMADAAKRMPSNEAVNSQRRKPALFRQAVCIAAFPSSWRRYSDRLRCFVLKLPIQGFSAMVGHAPEVARSPREADLRRGGLTACSPLRRVSRACGPHEQCVHFLLGLLAF